ncbi:MAG: methionine synthase [Candidatus Rokubacteria bacterium]|nr:methionine synthase [Candidatus Rokubacteria bacterium]
MGLMLLPTTVVGSYSMPGWLERLKTDYFLRRISRHDLEEIHDTAVKAAIKDQEMAGIDIVTDGELRRDNMIDYFAGRLPGVQIDHASKKFYYDFFDSVVRGKLPTAPLGLVDDFKFLRRFTERPTKFSITGPHSLVRRIRNEYYPSEEAFALDIARVMNLELRELVKAGATYLQIDEPYYSGFPEDVGWGVKVLNVLTEGVDAKIGLHICYGNRYGKPTWEGSYRYLFPAILDARVQQLTLEFARRGEEDVALFREFKAPFELGLGVIDVKNPTVETPDMVAERIRKALEIVPAERLYVNPDCGCLHLPRDVAFAKLCAMVEGTRLVRKELEA